jgi:hypothetical protein
MNIKEMEKEKERKAQKPVGSRFSQSHIYKLCLKRW